MSVEIIFVDDCSPDNTVEQVLLFRKVWEQKRQERDLNSLRIRIIRLAEHAGQQAAVYCGINNANGEKILTMDDDLQHPPSFIAEFLEKSENYDLSYALPRSDKRGQRLRRGSCMRDLFFRKILGCPPHIKPGSFRVLSRSTVEAVKNKNGSFVYVSALIFKTIPTVKVRNLYYENTDYKLFGNQNTSAIFTQKSESRKKSRFTTISRLILFLKLIVYYGLSFSAFRDNKKPYTIKDEL